MRKKDKKYSRKPEQNQENTTFGKLRKQNIFNSKAVIDGSNQINLTRFLLGKGEAKDFGKVSILLQKLCLKRQRPDRDMVLPKRNISIIKSVSGHLLSKSQLKETEKLIERNVKTKKVVTI